MSIGAAWRRFWFAETPLTRLGAFRMLIMALVMMDFLAYSVPAFEDARAVTSGMNLRPWSPIYLFEILGIAPIGYPTAQWVYAIGIVAAAMACIGLLTRTACIITAVLHTYLVGLVYSFGKAHHDQVVLTFALISLPLAPAGARLSLDALISRYRRARRGANPTDVPRTSEFALLPLRVTQVTACFGYAFAGWTKLVVSGFDWINGYTLMGHLMGHDNDWARFYTERVALCQNLSVGTLAVQGLFPLILFFPRLAWVFLPGAVFFHLSTWKTMDTGPYITLWFTLIAFLPLERIATWIAPRPVSRAGFPLGEILRLCIAAAPVILVLYVFSLYFPAWTALFLIPPLAALAIHLAPRSGLTVVYDGACGMCRRAFAVMKALDWTNALEGLDLRRWPAVQRRFPRLDQQACIRDMHSVDGDGHARVGFAAYQQIAWRLPLVAPLAWMLYLPPIPRIGRAIYRRVADRRATRGCGDAACPVHRRVDE